MLYACSAKADGVCCPMRCPMLYVCSAKADGVCCPMRCPMLYACSTKADHSYCATVKNVHKQMLYCTHKRKEASLSIALSS